MKQGHVASIAHLSSITRVSGHPLTHCAFVMMAARKLRITAANIDPERPKLEKSLPITAIHLFELHTILRTALKLS